MSMITDIVLDSLPKPGKVEDAMTIARRIERKIKKATKEAK